MIWFRIDVTLVLSVAFLELPAEVQATWLSAHACAAKHGGSIPKLQTWTKRMFDREMGKTKRQIDRLVESGWAAWAGPDFVDLEIVGFDTAGIERMRAKSEAARKAANSKWSRHANAVQTHMPTHAAADAPDRTGPDHTGPDLSAMRGADAGASAGSVSMSDLEDVYRTYPRKEGKAVGLRRARSEVRTPAKLEELRRAVAAYAAKVTAEGTEPRYVKHFSTFMKGWREYLDPDVAKPIATAAGSSVPVPSDVRRGAYRVTGQEKYRDRELTEEELRR